MGVSADDAGVSREISPQDDMYTGDDAAYYGVGRSALEVVRRGLDAAGVPADRVTRILDLPCGYGRVQRHLRAAFPAAEIVACDLMRGGVDFCAKAFGATPVYSEEDPAKVPLPAGAFDLVWVGSLLTHLGAGRWDDFLALFARVLRPGGVVVFSTHGRMVHDFVMRKENKDLPPWRAAAVCYAYERTGFGYAPYHGSRTYGHSLSTPAWVCDRVAAAGELRVVHVAESGWVGYQDVFACVREPGWKTNRPRTSVWTYLRHRPAEWLCRLRGF